MYVCMFVCMYICIFVCLFVGRYACMHVCMCVSGCMRRSTSRHSNDSCDTWEWFMWHTRWSDVTNTHIPSTDSIRSHGSIVAGALDTSRWWFMWHMAMNHATQRDASRDIYTIRSHGGIAAGGVNTHLCWHTQIIRVLCRDDFMFTRWIRSYVYTYIYI